VHGEQTLRDVGAHVDRR